MMEFIYRDYIIQLIDEPGINLDSTLTNAGYEKIYGDKFTRNYTSSKHGIKLVRNDQPMGSCLVLGSGGTTGIHSTSAILDNDRLILCCGNAVCCISLPELTLQWRTYADIATCFQLFKLQDDFIVHGELEISRIDKNGCVKWQFSGSDIFVSPNGINEIKIESDHILLTDFSQTTYTIDLDGNPY
ncbi:MAG: hypothetical protein EP332_09960 [Bacteroidetes bacterium]|nr:MAG: hypothetical protein EP332_09960 [Bacteroidota bacterium]